LEQMTKILIFSGIVLIFLIGLYTGIKSPASIKNLISENSVAENSESLKNCIRDKKRLQKEINNLKKRALPVCKQKKSKQTVNIEKKESQKKKGKKSIR